MQAKIDTSLVELLLSGCGQEWGSGSGGQREDTVQLKKREKYAITCVEDSIWPHISDTHEDQITCRTLYNVCSGKCID